MIYLFLWPPEPQGTRVLHEADINTGIPELGAFESARGEEGIFI